jgi:hypothetical protein
MICARLATALPPVGAISLPIFGPVAAIPFVILHGGGNGMLTIARGTLSLALFGPAAYGLRTEILSAPARMLQGGCAAALRLRAGSGRAARRIVAAGRGLMGSAFLALCALSASSAASKGRWFLPH